MIGIIKNHNDKWIVTILNIDDDFVFESEIDSINFLENINSNLEWIETENSVVSKYLLFGIIKINKKFVIMDLNRKSFDLLENAKKELIRINEEIQNNPVYR